MNRVGPVMPWHFTLDIFNAQVRWRMNAWPLTSALFLRSWETVCLMLIDEQMRLESFENKHQNKRDQTQTLKINAIHFLNDVWVAIINIVCRLMCWWALQEVMCVQNPVKQTKLLHEINYVIREELRSHYSCLFYSQSWQKVFFSAAVFNIKINVKHI